MPTCETPVSWLELEQLAVGEISAARREAVRAHLQECALCAAAQKTIAKPIQLTPLRAVARPRRPAVRWLAWSGGLAAAAAILFVVWSGTRAREFNATKGGGFAMELVRDSGGAQTRAPATFAAGDRFKVLISCDQERQLAVEVTVTQSGQVYRPLSAAELHCGNEVVLPGAFSVDGLAPVRVCVRAGKQARCRELLPRTQERDR